MQAAALKEAAGHLLDSVGAAGTCKTVTSTCALLADYINEACALATRLGILDTPLAFRNEASSGPRKTAAAPTIPVVVAEHTQQEHQQACGGSAILEDVVMEDVVMEEADGSLEEHNGDSDAPAIEV
nr:uncharacterized protein LOC117840694 [Setaria viridis]